MHDYLIKHIISSKRNINRSILTFFFFVSLSVFVSSHATTIETVIELFVSVTFFFFSISSNYSFIMILWRTHADHIYCHIEALNNVLLFIVPIVSSRTLFLALCLSVFPSVHFCCHISLFQLLSYRWLAATSYSIDFCCDVYAHDKLLICYSTSTGTRSHEFQFSKL